MELYSSVLLQLVNFMFSNEYSNQMSWCVRKFLRFAMYVLSWFVIPYSFYVSFRIKQKKVPPMKNSLLEIPAIKLAELIRSKQIKSENVIKAYVERCKEVNPILNAIVEDRFEAAIMEARQIDSEIANGIRTKEQMQRDTPLLGVPVTVKESLGVAGLSNQGGRKYKNKLIAQEDAPVVAQIKSKGAIILLVSNTPELCLCWETYNNVTGLTKNPYNVKRTVGGSSGGEAALVSSGASLLGITTDIAGSARLPAMFVGVFGHKPSPHVVSPLGHQPGSDDPCWGDFFTPGAMCRYAVDLPLLLECMRDPHGTNVTLDKPVDISKMKYFFMENDGPTGLTQPIQRDIKDAMSKVVQQFNAEKVKFDLLKWALDISMCKMLRIKNIETIYTKTEEGEKQKTMTKEILKYLCRLSDSDLPCVMIGPMQKIINNLVPQARHKFLDKVTAKLRKEFIDLLGDNGVFFYPGFPNTAHRHFEIFHKLVDTSYMMVFNTLGLPAASCMIGFDRNKLPIGIQVVASPGKDHLIFAVAKEIERLYGGWSAPPSEAI